LLIGKTDLLFFFCFTFFAFFCEQIANVVRSDHFQKLVKAIPLEQLVLETDSPALVPELDLTLDASQRRNEPMNVALSAQKIAEIKKLSLEQVCKQTTENAKKLFPRMFL